MEIIDEIEFGPMGVSIPGTINGALNNLGTYESMTLELLQNAEDSKSRSVRFEISDEALIITTDSLFVSCRDFKLAECSMREDNPLEMCDWHRLREIASGDKPHSVEQKIGRFGIGFVSVYQVTDSPEIRSAGRGLKFHPLMKQVQFLKTEIPGTEIRLPWAVDPESKMRRALTYGETVDLSKLDEMAQRISAKVENSLIFLSNVSSVEIARNSKILQKCVISKKNSEEKSIHFTSDGRVENWYLLDVDAEPEFTSLENQYVELARHGRRKTVQIAVPIDANKDSPGRIFAFLPTEVEIEIPVCINGDFFIDTNRKDVRFEGSDASKAESVWNATILKVAAKSLSLRVRELHDRLGDQRFWNLVNSCLGLATRAREAVNSISPSFETFWVEMKNEIPNHALVLCEGEGEQLFPVKQVLVVDGENLTRKKASLVDLGLHPIHRKLARYLDVITLLGAQKVELGVIVKAMEQCEWIKLASNQDQISLDVFEARFRPLQELLNDYLPKFQKTSLDDLMILRLKALTFVVTDNFRVVSPRNCFALEEQIKTNDFAFLFPDIRIASTGMRDLSSVWGLCTQLTLGKLVQLVAERLLSQTNGKQAKVLEKIYDLFFDITYNRHIQEDDFRELSELAMWPSMNGSLISRNDGKVLGEFSDPLKIAQIVNIAALSEKHRKFFIDRLKAQTLNIKNYILEILPAFFSTEQNSIEKSDYRKLFLELSNQPKVFDDPQILKALRAANIVPTHGKTFCTPSQVVFYDRKIAELFGSDFDLWLDESYISKEPRVKQLFQKLGVQAQPSVEQLIALWLKIVSARISPTRRNQVGKILAILAEKNESASGESFERELERVKDQHCLPASGDDSSWRRPSELYSPEYAKHFSTQRNALVVGLPDASRKTLAFVVNKLGVKAEPELKLVLSHIETCRLQKYPLDNSIYTYLNMVAKRTANVADQSELKKLRDTPIYLIGKDYLKPSQLYFEEPHLDKPWAYKVAGTLLDFKELLALTGVKTRPGSRDYVEVLRELRDFASGHPERILRDEHSNVYKQCMKQLNWLRERGEIDESLAVLQQENLYLSREKRFVAKRAIFIPDSEWFSKQFQGVFDEYIVEYSELFPQLLAELEIPYVSKSIDAKRGEIKGSPVRKATTQKSLNDRGECIRRILSALKGDTDPGEFWNAVEVYEVQEVQSHWNLRFSSGTSKSQIITTPVFYDQAKRELYIASGNSKVGSSVDWLELFQELLHQVMPAVAENDIRNAVGTLDFVMTKEPAEGIAYLTRLGYSFEHREEFEPLDSPSTVVTEFGGDGNAPPADPPDHPEEGLGPTADQKAPAGGSVSKPTDPQEPKLGGPKVAIPSDGTSPGQSGPDKGPTGIDGVKPGRGGGATPYPGPTVSDPAGVGDTPQGGTGNPGDQTGPGKPRHGKGAGPGQEQEVRRAFIYVLNGSDSETKERIAENKRNGEKAVDFVMEYERKEGRDPFKMPDRNKGYDIESSQGSTDDPEDDEIRFIEVKSVTGAWGATGVELSFSQLKMAYSKQDQYWLYVVENFQNQNRRIHKIQNPASYIKGYKFNDAWKEIAQFEELGLEAHSDIVDAIQTEDIGCLIHHRKLGPCFLVDWKIRGTSVVVYLDFDDGTEPRPFPYNPTLMKKING